MAILLKSSALSIAVKLCLLAAFCVPSSLACMCSPTHPEQQFCQADFVLSGHVLEKNPVNDIRLRGRFGQFDYSIDVDRVYKGSDQLEDGATEVPLSVLTSPMDILCHPKSLKIGAKYLITGSIVDGQLHMSSCDWVEDWRDVTHQQRQGLKTFYQRYCTQCTIQSTMKAWGANSASTATGGCIYDPAPAMRHGAEDCQALYATCVIQGDQACQWYHRGNDYQQCIQRNRPFYQGVETAKSVNFPFDEGILT